MTKSYRCELVGAFGDPIDENPTVVLEDAAFKAAQLNYKYLNIMVKQGDLPDALAGLKAMNFKGINCTIPHKCDVVPLLDEVSEAASIIGAVNVIVNRNGYLWGDNTDGKGFLESLRTSQVDPKGKKVTILGAGGAARAIAVELALAGADQITLVNRSLDKAQAIAAILNTKTAAKAVAVPWETGQKIPEDTALLVNCTPIGLYPDVDQKPEIDYNTLRPDMVVCDVITNHPHTLFLQEAEKRGAKTIDGLGMLVNQGAINFTLWTGVDAPKDVMMQAIKNEFSIE